MRNETHVRNSHKWTRCAILGLALTVTSLVGVPAATAISHTGGVLAASAPTTTSASSGTHSDSSKWT